MEAIRVLTAVAISVVAGVLLLPMLADAISLLRLRRRVSGPTAPTVPPRFLFLVPAHDEELLIGDCIHSLFSLGYPRDRYRVVVIADNCSDRTAEIVRGLGAECWERHDVSLPGKPRAIEWALERVDLAEYDTVVIVDADTIVDPDFLRQIAVAAPLRDKAVQGYHDVSNPDDNALTRLSAVFGTARYRFAFPLKQRASLNTPLMGNGMCVGTGLIATYGWRAFSICEDWEMYALLTRCGVKIDVVPAARVFSQEARSLSQSTTQRQRWAAGKITVLRDNFLPLLGSRDIGPHQKLDVLAELTASGPVVHLGTVAVLAPAVVLLGLPGATWIAAALGGSLLRLALYTALSIRHEPRPIRTLAAFLFLPFYTVWRLGVQITALRMLGDQPWVRTRRHAAKS